MTIRLNVKKAALAAFNVIVSIVFFFRLRRAILRVFGNPIGIGTTIHRGITFFSFERLSIGNNSTINAWCFLDSRGGLSIGNNVNISHSVRIYSMGHDVTHPDSPAVESPVHIDDGAWIFPNALVMPGVRIGKNAVVYPGSVVTRDIPPNTFVGGNPARAIKVFERSVNYNAAFPVWFGV